MAVRKLFPVIAFLVASSAAIAEPVTRDNIVGTWEGTLIDPDGTIKTVLGGIKTYIVRFEIGPDLVLRYTEFHNKARTAGILGTAEIPACAGTARFAGQKLLLAIDCSRYTTTYTSEIELAQKNIDPYLTKNGLPTAVVTSLFPLPILFQLKKLAD